MLTAAVVLPVAALLCLLTFFMIHFAGGGDLGGYGAAAQPPYGAWVAPVQGVTLVATLCLVVSACVGVPWWFQHRAASWPRPRAEVRRPQLLTVCLGLLVLSAGVLLVTDVVLFQFPQ